MNAADITLALQAIADRAEYMGRQRGIALRTRSKREAQDAIENEDISRKVLARDIVALTTRLLSEGITE